MGVKQATKRSGIPKDLISIAVSEILTSANPKPNSRSIISWRLVALNILRPKYRWKTELFTNGVIKNGALRGNIYFVGHGDPKWIPEKLDRLTKQLRALGIQRIDGNLVFNRSAYAKQVMEEARLMEKLYVPITFHQIHCCMHFALSPFRSIPIKIGDGFQITYTPKLARLSIQNNILMSSAPCDRAKRTLPLEMVLNLLEMASSQAKNKSAIQWQAIFSGELPQNLSRGYIQCG